MKTIFYPILTIALLSCIGCRRTDVREMTVSMPGLKESDRTTIENCLLRYDGILPGSLEWDFSAKTLTLKYDSMKIAQSNIRYAIDEKGIKVLFPVKTNNHAGY